VSYVWLTWLADALRAEGCDVAEDCGDWKHRGRPSSSGSFSPYGVLQHHTGSTASYSNPFPTKNTLINGRPDLSGPLCQVGIGYDGVCHMIAAGRANHAGACNGWGPFSSSQDGNAQLVGFEIDYDGTQSISPEQRDAATMAGAAVLRRFGRDEGYCATHAETSTTGKWDTGGVSGGTWRQQIKTWFEEGGMPTAQEISDAIWAYAFTTGWQSDGDYGGSQTVAASKIMATGYGTAVMINGGAQPQPLWTMSAASVQATAEKIHSGMDRHARHHVSVQDIVSGIMSLLKTLSDEARADAAAAAAEDNDPGATLASTG
jgi:N-acetylmuramoyl-L-alanine amidase